LKNSRCKFGKCNSRKENRLASKENIAVRSENTIPNKKRENVSGENAISKTEKQKL